MDALKHEIAQLKAQLIFNNNHWVYEVKLLEDYWIKKDKPTIRDLAVELRRSKSWIADSLQLVVGLRVYPYLEKEKNRTAAIKYIAKRKAMLKLMKGA